MPRRELDKNAIWFVEDGFLHAAMAKRVAAIAVDGQSHGIDVGFEPAHKLALLEWDQFSRRGRNPENKVRAARLAGAVHASESFEASDRAELWIFSI